MVKTVNTFIISYKILESVIYKKIITFIRPKLSKTQFGFTKGKSCLAQLLTAFSTISQAIDNQQSADVMYLDFRRCYLTNRLHYVTIDDYSQQLIYINNLPSCINNSDCLLFADDAKIIHVISKPPRPATPPGRPTQYWQWCSAWNLQLNSDKCPHTEIHAKQSCANLKPTKSLLPSG